MEYLPFHKIRLFFVFCVSNICSIIQQTEEKVKCKSELLKCFSVQYIHTLFLNSLDKASENYKSEQKNNTDKGDVKYSISRTQNMSWDDQVNGLLKKSGQIKRNDTLVIENSTPMYLQSDEIEDLPLAVPISVITKATNGKDVSHSIKKEKIVDLQKGIKNAEYVIKNPDRNSFAFITDVKQNGHPVLVSFLQNTEFDSDRVHKATSIHLQIDVNSMLKSLPKTATIYVKNKNKFNNAVGATNNLRGLSAKVEFIDDILPQNSEKSTENPKYSLSVETETAYNEAVKNNDIATAQKIVDDIAKENGYNSPILYHGTNSFGFTTFDLEKMDDKRSIFLTSSPDIASTYSGMTGTRNIGNEIKNIINMSDEELVNELNEYDKLYKKGTTEGEHRYELYDLKKTNKLIADVNSGIDSLKVFVDEQIKNYAIKNAEKFDEDNARIYKQLVGLSEKLNEYDYNNLSTPIYLLLHHTDVFNGSAEIASLEKNIRLMNQLRNVDTSNGVIVDEALGGYIIELLSIDEAKQHLKNRLKQGNYSLYAKLGKSLVIDGNGQLWKDIRYWTSNIEIEPTDVSVIKKDGFYWIVNNETNEIIPSGKMAVNSFTDELYLFNKNRLRALMVDKANQILRINTENINTTRGISKFAQEQGYDSVVFKNIRDNGGMNTEVDYDEVADIYVIFDPNSIKSADAVTYDDNGNVIPLSERFKADNNDIRYSKDVDSDGNTLSKQQQEYFKDSKVRDENGNLLVVYHGTSEDFTVFDREKGRSNMDIQGSFFSPWELDARGYGANVRAFYLNITNPASEALAYKALRKFQGQNNAGLKAREYLERLGYDGVNNGNEEYIAFYSNQIKNVDNVNPTDSDDIRFSKDVDNINDLKRENKKLKEANELLRHEFELTGGLETSLSSATNIGRHIKEAYNSSLPGAEIGRDIKAMCDRVMQDEYRSYDILYDKSNLTKKTWCKKHQVF
ncbi:MAG: hypothetical protein ACI4V4_07345 [Eubacterium sp.]